VATYVVRVARQATVFLLFLLTIVLGAVSGVLFAFAGDLPQISALDDYAPSTITRIHASNGEVVGEFATQRRTVVTYDEISPLLRQAIVAAEDKDFDKHVGLSVPRILAALAKDILERRKAGGASTITQQLARNLFLTFEKTWERKIKEAILAIQIEKRYTKREILTMYCNTIYFGHGAYGVEAASRLYFGKPAKALVLEEAALIAGIIQGNVRQSPYINPEAAARRRNYALQRMAEEGFISQDEARKAIAAPIRTAGLPTQHYSPAPYFVEEVRQQLEARFGAKQLYENGLSVQTSLDLPLQLAATRALQHGLRRLDQRRGFREPSNLLAAGADLDAYRHPRWQGPMVVGDVVPAVVTGTTATEIQARAGRLDVRIPKAGFDWTGKATASALVARGDLVQVLLEQVEEGGHTATGRLDQEPELQGAVVALDNRTGRILAMSGGFDFDRSKFNRAIQASRQLGSTFKLVVYTAAIDRGYTPASTLLDAPVSFPGGAGSPAYAPMNYDRTVQGPISLRRALEQSRNVPTVRLMNALGPKQVIQYAKKLGFTSTIPPYLSSALGAGDHERLLALPEPGRAHDAVPDHQGDRSRRQRARGEPAGADRGHSRRHGLRDDQPAAGRRAARDGRPCGGAAVAARRQDRHHRRLHRRVVHRLRSRHHHRGLGGVRHQAADRAGAERFGGGVADLDRRDAALGRAAAQGAQGRARVPGPGQHRVRHQRDGRQGSIHRGHRARRGDSLTRIAWPGSAPASCRDAAMPGMSRAGHAPPRGLGHQVGLDEAVDVAVEHAGDVAFLVLGAVVLHHLVRVQDVAADLAAEGNRLLLAAEAIELGLLLLQLHVVQA
jgi:penicillin-binding protein 1A